MRLLIKLGHIAALAQTFNQAFPYPLGQLAWSDAGRVARIRAAHQLPAQTAVVVCREPCRSNKLIDALVGQETRRHDGHWRRSEERRVGKECVSTCRSRWSRYHSKKKQKKRT